MLPFPFSLFPPFNYDPTTNWQGAFSPKIEFNENPDDAPIEAHVLAKTGSYGKQLGILIYVVDILLKKVNPTDLNIDEQAARDAFDTLRDNAKKAADDYRNGVSADDILGLAKTFSKHRTPTDRETLLNGLEELLGPRGADGTAASAR